MFPLPLTLTPVPAASLATAGRCAHCGTCVSTAGAGWLVTYLLERWMLCFPCMASYTLTKYAEDSPWR